MRNASLAAANKRLRPQHQPKDDNWHWERNKAGRFEKVYGERERRDYYIDPVQRAERNFG